MTHVAAHKPGDDRSRGEMPTGPKATRKSRSQPKSLSAIVRETETLLRHAWHAIRRNGETSRSPKTRQETKNSAQTCRANLIHSEAVARKALPVRETAWGHSREGKGKGKRPLVIAPIEDRIVQRAILDVLQEATELTEVQAVLATPTSIGGIRGRGVEHAIKIIELAYNDGQADL